MANYNKVILAGNLTRDPQLSYTANNTAVADFGMAINRKWRGPDGNTREETTFVDCKVFGRGAEVFSQYMSKGRPVLIDGRLDFYQWQAQDGSKRSKLSVVVENFQFLGGTEARGGGGPRPAEQGQAGPARPAPQQQPQQQRPAEDYGDTAPDYEAPEMGGPEDDIPF